MQQESRPGSEITQSEHSVSYLNKQIQEGARVTVRHYGGYDLDSHFPVTKVGTDFVALLMDNGQEQVIPRTSIKGFVVTKPKHQNTRP